MIDSHQTDLLKQMYAEYRDRERKCLLPQPYKAVLETLVARSGLEHTWRVRRDALVNEGLIRIVEDVPGRWQTLELTVQGREIAKRMFEEMLKKDGWTEERFFNVD